MNTSYHPQKCQEALLSSNLLEGVDGQFRCSWQRNIHDYCRYHDEEWGFPVINDQKLFEKICLECFQAGLSWLMILRKRDSLRAAFAEFQIETVASFGEKDITYILGNPNVVRHRGKVLSVINNARLALELKAEFKSLAHYFWKFEPKSDIDMLSPNIKGLPIISPTTASIKLAKDLKRRGWTFVGPIMIYSFMQATGIVNGHFKGCIMYDKIENIRNTLVRP